MPIADLFSRFNQFMIDLTEPDDTEDDTTQYPVYAGGFTYNIVWRCLDCDTEFLKEQGDRGWICPECVEHYKGRTEDDMPDAVRARCPRCDNVSNEVYAVRAENTHFDCPHCPFWWESSRY